MNDQVKQAVFIRAALIEAEAAAQALPPGAQRRALISAQRRLHARLYAGLQLIEESYPGITAQVVPDSGGGDKQTSFADGVGPEQQKAA
jgi:hypothetical protein